jgi:hypothetical protein
MQMTESTPSVSHDAIKLLSDLLALVASPATSKKVIDALLSASAEHQTLIDQAHARTVQVLNLRDEVSAAVATMRSQAAERIAADTKSFDERVAAQTNALAAREARAASLEQKAVEHEAASAKMRQTLAEKMRLLSA